VKLNREQFLAAAMMIGALNAAACKQSSSSPDGTKNTARAETAPAATAEGAPPPAAEGAPPPAAEAPPVPTAEGPQIPGVAGLPLPLPLPLPLATAVPAASAVTGKAVKRVQEILPGLPPVPTPGR
jgi:hypothetical protein